MAWWEWMLIGWLALAVCAALPLGMVIRGADRRALGQGGGTHGTDPALALIATRRPTDPLPPRRRRLPVPPIAVTLIGTGVGLEILGFVLRSTGQEHGTALLLSMDAPMSVPRLFIAALFAAAAVAAALGGSSSPGRRTWWLCVAAVAAVAAEVKGGGTTHVRALHALGLSEHAPITVVGSALLVAAVLGTLFWVSRVERRDRRRVLLAFGLYGVAAVGLSAVASAAGDWSTFATFVEETGEVLGGVAVLIAVLVGVAPRLVLPSDWALRRTADAETIDAPGALRAWTTASAHLHT
jgi:hypothetical protein